MEKKKRTGKKGMKRKGEDKEECKLCRLPSVFYISMLFWQLDSTIEKQENKKKLAFRQKRELKPTNQEKRGDAQMQIHWNEEEISYSCCSCSWVSHEQERIKFTQDCTFFLPFFLLGCCFWSLLVAFLV